ncbi:hypothetical protein [Paracraurococcus lichenis]|uniref:General stress protein 17M-like domain-containing protein n=1 Tax=Paracraurococcus lichenis TaxID=3064888 RepID=A0ABT9EEX5_9PROT|nr:hypothetical protein [Paracraurococcus sp. LOR1-02]MDO9714435.1 hypothetical protein [Paracraurococcus sp. LOR1-02]
MTIRTITRMFDGYAGAAAAVHDLEAAGFSPNNVSLIGSGRGEDATASAAHAGDADRNGVVDSTESGAGTGAGIGAVLGGGAGLLAGLGALAVPGLGPIVAAGWLVATLTGAGAGAAAGGLLGALTSAGVDEADTPVYAEGVRRGAHIVAVRTDESRLGQAEAILARHGPVDIAQRGADYRAGGWTGHSDHGAVLPSTPEGTPGNPPGTMASRALDRAAGTNVSGAYPSQSDGTPANPPGTAAERTFDRMAGTNASGAHPGAAR